MNPRNQELDEFFNRYADRFNKALSGGAIDIEGTVNSFTKDFIEASPLGVIPGKNGKEFREAIPKGYEYYKSAGITSMDILAKDIILLDEFHAMVKIHWSSVYTKKDKTGAIEFDVFYFIQTLKEGEHKIFAYVTGDEQKVMKEKGLV